MKVSPTFSVLLVLFLCAPLRPLRVISVVAAEEKPAPVVAPVAAAPKPVLKIEDSELERKVVLPATKFSWIGKPPLVPPVPKPVKTAPADPAAPGQPNTAMDMNGDNMILKSFGPFTREEIKSKPELAEPDKEVMTLTRNVEIEMVETQSGLRGETVVITRDIKTGEAEIIDAKGNVQFYSPDRVGKGDIMRIDMLKDASGEYTKNEFVLIGDPVSGKKATLWLKKDPNDPSQTDIVEATRFFRDEKLDFFRATGSPNAITILPAEDPAAAATSGPKSAKDKQAPIGLGKQADKPALGLGAAAPAKPAAKPPPPSGSGTGLGGMNMSSGGRVNMRADAEMTFDGPTGKLNLTKNVVIIKEAPNPPDSVKICADKATITMDVPPPGQPVSPGAALGGEMKMIECFGRVEIKTGTRTILCDKMRLDQERNVLYLDMTVPTDPVYIYDQNVPNGGSTMIASKALKINLDTQEIEHDGPMKTSTFSGPPGSNRGNGPRPDEVKPAIDPKAKPNPNDPNAKPAPPAKPKAPAPVAPSEPEK